MSQYFFVSLSLEAASPMWGENALLSFSEGGAVIHLDESKPLFTQVQSAARKLDTMSLPEITLQGEHWDCDLRWAFSQGLFNAKKGAPLNFGDIDAAQLNTLTTRKSIVEWVRNTINLSPEDLSPEVLCHSAAELIEAHVENKAHLSYQVISGDQLVEQGFQGIYQVGRGSVRPGAMLQLDYNPSGDDNAPVEYALVGKGITFDSGGYSLKPSAGMSIMKSDMGGAATLAGALALAASNGVKKRIKLYLCCAENLVSGHAFKLGDIITYKNGVTAEILNTDAEGRLVMADGLIAAQQDNPAKIIDAATLTGAAKMAVGRDYNCVLTMDDQFAQIASDSAKGQNEKLWRLPFEPFHLQQISSSFADIANIQSGEGMAGASTAAAFLAHFVKTPEQNWLHFDLSGCYQLGANNLWAAGGKGHGVLMLSDIISA